MSDRGDYRSIYVSFWDDADVHALSDRAYRVLTTLKGTLPPSGAGIVYTALLAQRCGTTVARVEAALTELERPKAGESFGWIVRERNVVWIVNALRYEPTLSASNSKHRTYVARLLAPLGERLTIVESFRRYYADWFAGLSDSPDNGTAKDTLSDATDSVGYCVSKHVDVDVPILTIPKQTSSSSAGATALHARLASDTDRAALDALLASVKNPETWSADLTASLDGMAGHRPATPLQLGLALREFAKNGATTHPNSAHFDAYLRRATHREAEGKSATKSPTKQPVAATPNGYGKHFGGHER